MYLSCSENTLSKKYLKEHIDIKRNNKEKMEGVHDNASAFTEILKGNLIIWSKYRWNIEKWVLRKLMSLIF